MATYQIELQQGRVPRLIKDDHPNAAYAFDGGSILYAPESYPATICHSQLSGELVVLNHDEWVQCAKAYNKGDIFSV